MLWQCARCAGFLLNGRYRAQSTIKRVICTEEKESFISFDQLGLQLWSLKACSSAAVCSRRLPFPRSNFVTCMSFISGPKLVACACLDGCLRLYKYNLKLKSTLPWGETAVFDMHHIKSTNELIVSGTQGVKVRSGNGFINAWIVEWTVALIVSFAITPCSKNTAQAYRLMHDTYLEASDRRR